MGTADRRQNVISLTWAQLHQDVRSLALQLAKKGPFKGIVAVACGGLVPAGILARACHIRLVETVCLQSGQEQTGQSIDKVLKAFSPDKDEGEGWLVVDDMAATGRTAALLRAMLPKAHIAAVYAKEQGIAQIDSYSVEVPQDAWLLFPWDSQLPALSKKTGKSGRDPHEK
jgi:xanthine phosphoribosyltransferase